MNHFIEDLRLATRSLAKTPGFTAVAVLTLALGIGANSALYAVLDTVLLRALPYPESERLVRVHHVDVEEGVTNGQFSPQDFDDVEAAAQSFQSLAAFLFEPGEIAVSLQGDGEPISVSPAYVSPDFFTTLGMPARVGRNFHAGENVAGNDRVAVIGSSLWERRFGKDPGIIGRTVILDGESFTVVGVAPEDFAYPAEEADVWLPLSLIGEDDIPSQRDLRWLRVVGRLAPGASIQGARSELDGLLAGLADAFPESNKGWTEARVVPLRESLVGDVRPALLVLGGAVSLVLLIACANLANLLLARGSARQGELALRTALGAQRSRLVGHLFSESLLLALLGGAAGLLVGFVGLDALVGLAGDRLPHAGDIALDSRVVAFTFLVSAASALLFGLAPALRMSHKNSADVLREGGRGSTGMRSPLRSALVVAQTALAVLLLVGAGLLVKSLWQLTGVDPGFHAERVLVAGVSYPDLPMEERHQRRERLLAEVAEVPGVVAVGGAKTLPMSGGGEPWAVALPSSPDVEIRPAGGGFPVTPGYFEALSIPVHAGRGFSDADAEGPPTVIVSRSLAEQLWPAGDAVGKSVLMFGLELTVQAVVGDVRVAGLETPPLSAAYLPAHLAPRSTLKLFIRAAGDPAALAGAVRARIREVEPDLPIEELAPLKDLVARTTLQPRLVTTLLGLLGALALALSLVGLYGVISYLVNQRGREFGVRMALGADRSQVIHMVLGWTARLAGLGIVLGLAGALLFGRALSSQLYAVAPSDPATLATVALVLGVGAMLAGWLPARRAAGVEPSAALRQE